MAQTYSDKLFSRWVIVDDPWSYHEFEMRGGVYVVYADGVLIYIGQSANVRARIGRHKIRLTLHNQYHTPWGHFNRLLVKVSYCRRFGEWAMREMRLIRRLRPRENSLGNSRRSHGA